ncbi:hypothetical protein D910_03975 [Dendroctonus ponderosae]|uniref:Uncharacterized protein n=1 Tax=Dendroctonus ponderosae TaxID=77166 RepID=U4U2M3_DENPD|nr:hypothetical protein D910_03975 [Dendroctonus ponderosae]
MGSLKAQVSIALTIAPVPGTTISPPTGKRSSVFVARNRQCCLLRYVAALIILLNEKCSSKPTITAPTSGSGWNVSNVNATLF